MQTSGANLRRIHTDINISAITTAPDDVTVSGKHSSRIDIVIQVAIPFFMLLLGDRYGCPRCGNYRKAFFSGDCSKSGIEMRMLLMFAVRSRKQVLGSGTDFSGRKTSGYFQIASFQKFEKTLGMFFFLIGSFFKNVCDLNKALIFCDTGAGDEGGRLSRSPPPAPEKNCRRPAKTGGGKNRWRKI